MGASDRQCTRIKQADLDCAPGEPLASTVAEGGEIEGVAGVLLLTDRDHCNALAATTIAGRSGMRPTVAPNRDPSPRTHPGETLFRTALNGPALTARCTAGACLTT
jgi:hypothetical protein